MWPIGEHSSTYWENRIFFVDDVNRYSYAVYVCAYWSNGKHSYFRQNNDSGTFFVYVFDGNTLFSDRNDIWNEINAHRAQPCWRHTVSGYKHNNVM